MEATSLNLVSFMSGDLTGLCLFMNPPLVNLTQKINPKKLSIFGQVIV